MPNGELPDRCPECKEHVIWEWEGENRLKGDHFDVAECPECGATFKEIFKTVRWQPII